MQMNDRLGKLSPVMETELLSGGGEVQTLNETTKHFA